MQKDVIVSAATDTLSEKHSLILVVARTALLGIAILWASYYTWVQRTDIDSAELFVPLAIFFGFTVISGLWLANYKPGPIFTQLELIVYALMSTVIIYFSGLAGSPLLFMYLPLAMVTVILTSRNNALLISAVSLTFYYVLIQNYINSWLVLPEIAPVLVNPPQGLNFQLLSLASGMTLVTIATGYLKEKLTQQLQTIQNATVKIESQAAEEKDILDELSSGVIVFDLQGRIVKYNHSLLKILKVNSDSAEQIAASIWELFPQAKEVLAGMPAPSEELKATRDCDDLIHLFSCRLKWIETRADRHLVLIIQDNTQLRNAENELALQNEMARLLANPTRNFSESLRVPGFIGESPQIKAIFKTIAKVAPADTTILITGESGTGKELVAKAIHASSSRNEAPFVAVNCGAIPESLIESQLFGHRRGSFTGAVSDHKGYFQQAEGGTLFLDEIGELPLNLQAKLLRTIQEKTIRPVGGEYDLPVNVRIVSATNRDLGKETSAGKFREDLYYRLNVISISLPPLRDRKDDIPLLVKNILSRLVKNGAQPVIPPDSMRLLMNHNYPGNIRELENIIERAFVLGGEIILPEHFPESLRGNAAVNVQNSKGTETIVIENVSEIKLSDKFDLDTYLAEVERKFLETALNESAGIKTKAAEKLGMNFRSFRYRLQKFGISDEDGIESGQ